MRATFRAYYPPAPADMAELWSEGLLILDTNALLNLFRYSQRAREDFLKALTAKADALWLPHQVGMEFHRRRIEIINEQSTAFGELQKALEKARGQVDQAFTTYTRHPSLDVSPLRAEFGDAVAAVIEKLHSAREEHLANMVATNTNNEIFTRITELYEGRVGAAYTDDELAQLYKEGATRYEKQIPPGYKDSNKGEPRKYGDLVLWKQTLAHVATSKQPAIFVTNNQKEDWWYIVDSERYGGRPELIEEYYAASGQRVHFMTTDRFLDFAKSQVTDIRRESVDELESIARESADRQVEQDTSWASNATWKMAEWIRNSQRPPYEKLATGIAAHGNEDLAEATSVLANVSRMISILHEEIAHVRRRVLHEGPSPELDEQLAQLDHQMGAARRLEGVADRNLDKALEKARAERLLRPRQPSADPAPDGQREPPTPTFLEYP